MSYAYLGIYNVFCAEGNFAETDTEQTSRGRGRSRGRTSTRNGNRGRTPARRCRSRNAVSTVTSTRNSGNDDADHSPAAADDLTFQAKDGTFWYKEARRQPVGRQTAANIMPTAPGPTKYAIRNIATPADAFQLYMRSAIFKEVLNWTNKEGGNIYGTQWHDVSDSELKTFMGLSILAGVYKSRNEAVRQLWSLEDGRPIFNRSMPRNRFQQISWAMRFDDAANRRQRASTDKLEPIRKVFDMWESTLQDAFVPDENVTVDEQLLTYRGRVPFKQYIPSKPGKYGIKLWMLCDSKTSYVCRLQVYTGRVVDQPRKQNQGERVVLDLTRELKGSGRNVTVDNFFVVFSRQISCVTER